VVFHSVVYKRPCAIEHKAAFFIDNWSRERIKETADSMDYTEKEKMKNRLQIVAIQRF